MRPMDLEFWIVTTLNRALAYGTPILLATLGEIYAERSGVLNLGVEGMMILGAFFAFCTTFFTANPWLGVLIGALVAGLASLLHAFLSITLRVNQIISGLALTMLGLGISGTLGRGWEGKILESTIASVEIDYLSKIPVLGPILFTNQNSLVHLAILIAFGLWFLLFKTRIGISIRAVGENPAAADVMGINVWKIRYLCVFLGGLLAGLAGSYLSVAYQPAWASGMTAGMGWLAVALTIFAFWNPLLGMVGAFLFGALYHLSFRLQNWVAPEILNSLPYLFPIVVLIIVARFASKKRIGAPAVLGQPYKRGE